MMSWEDCLLNKELRLMSVTFHKKEFNPSGDGGWTLCASAASCTHGYSDEALSGLFFTSKKRLNRSNPWWNAGKNGSGLFFLRPGPWMKKGNHHPFPAANCYLDRPWITGSMADKIHNFQMVWCYHGSNWNFRSSGFFWYQKSKPILLILHQQYNKPKSNGQ